MLTSLYPSHPWQEWRFGTTGWWKQRANQLKYVKWLGEHLNITRLEDWYKVGVEVFSQNHGAAQVWQLASTDDSPSIIVTTGYSLLREFKGSPTLAIMQSFPSHQFKPWRFLSAPKGWWAYDKNCRTFLDDFANYHKLTKVDDWYSITLADITKHGGMGFA